MNKKTIRHFVKAIIAGMFIGLGGTVYLSVDNAIISAMLFAFGLFMIVSHGLPLFTGAVGQVVFTEGKERSEFIVSLCRILTGNLIGTSLVGYAISLTRHTHLITKAQKIIEVKFADGIQSILILSFFCGILMFFAVQTNKIQTSDLNKTLAIFLCVTVFILSGYEHCIANVFYAAAANAELSGALVPITVAVIGNSLGGIVIAGIYKFAYSN